MCERVEVIAHDLNRSVPLRVVPSNRQHVWVGHETHFDEESLNRSVGDIADKSTKRKRDETESKADTPLAATDTSDLERGAADEHNQYLDCDLCGEVRKSTA